MPRVVEAKHSFRRIAAAGVFFQGGAAAIDNATIVSALVHQLTGSVVAVGAAATIARAGWLVPQLFIGYAAQRSERRMPYYLAGAVGRAVCLTALGLVLWFSSVLTLAALSGIFFVLWTMYSFIGGIVAVPYNDIVARSVTSGRRSRLLAIRFFGGGLLALGVAAIAHVLLGALPFPNGFAALLLVGAMLLFSSAMLFVSAGEPPLAANPSTKPPEFVAFLKTRYRRFSVRSTLSPFRMYAVAWGRDVDGASVLRPGDRSRQRLDGTYGGPAWFSDRGRSPVQCGMGVVGRSSWQTEPAYCGGHA